MAFEKKLMKLSLKQKASILEKLKSGVSVKVICNEFKINKSTVTRIIQQEIKLKGYMRDMEIGPGQRQTLKQCEYPKMEKALYKWFCFQREHHVPISVEVVKAKARKLHEKIKEKDGSTDGCQISKKWHGIRRLKICGEKLSNKAISVNPFITYFKKRIDELDLLPYQIYNADESGLFLRIQMCCLQMITLING